MDAESERQGQNIGVREMQKKIKKIG